MSKRREITAFCLLAATATVAYYPGLVSPFQFDDEAGILMNPALWSIADIKSVLSYKMDLPRPLFNISLALDSSIWGVNAFGFHLTNFILLLAGALLVWRFCVELLLTLDRPEEEVHKAGMAAGFLFALHPAATEATIYIWSRSSGLMSVFLFGAAVAWLRGLRTGGRKWLAASFVLYLMGLASKEEAVFFPALLLALELTLFGKENRKRRLLYMAPFWLMPFLLLIARWLVADAGLDFVSWRAGQSDELAWRAEERGLLNLVPYNFATQAKVALYNLRLFLWPFNLSVDHGVAFESGFPSTVSIAGIILILALVLFFLIYHRRFPVASVCAALFILPVAVFFVVPIVDAMVERRLFFPLSGLAILVGVTLARIESRHKRATWALAISMSVFFGALTHLRARVWRDRIGLWENAVRVSPEKLRPRMTLARYLMEEGLIERAVSQNVMALHMRPNYHTAVQNLGLLFLRKGDLDAAEKYFLQAVKIHPDAGFTARYNLGLIYQREGRYDKAREQFEKSIEINPGMATSLSKLGIMAMEKKDYFEAISYFRRALEVNPDMLEARMNLGMTLSELRRYDEAVAELRKAKSIDPGADKVRFNLGVVLMASGRLNEAEAEFLGMAKAGMPLGYFGLAEVKRRQRDYNAMASALESFLHTVDRDTQEPLVAEMINAAAAMLQNLKSGGARQ